MAKEVLEMEVKSNIKSVTKDTDKMAESVKGAKEETKGLAKETEDVGKAAKKSSGGVKTLAKGFGSLMKSLGIIGLIAAAFGALKEALERNQKVMDVVSTIMSTISTTFNQVVDVLTDTVKWVTESSDRFDGLTKVMSGIMTIALTPLKAAFYGLKLGVQEVQLAWEKWIGGADPQKMAELRAGIVETRDALEDIAVAAIDAGKDIGTNIGDAIGEIGAMGKMAIEGITDISIKSNYELAKATTAAKNSSALAEAQIQGLIEKNDLLAETQRQIRDDETKTFAERIAANDKLNDILDTQEKEMLALADTRVASAALELSANKDNIELQVAYQQTLNDRAGVEAQVAGFRSEQMTNEVSLNKELLETKKEVVNATLEGMALELQELKNSYAMQLEMARKSGEDTTALTEKYAKDKKKIEDDAAKNTKSINKADADAARENVNSQLEAFSGLAGALGSLAGESKELAVGQAIVDTYVGANKAFAQGGTVGFVTAASVVAAGLANVQKILSTPVGDGGGGGSAGGAPQTPAPQMMSGAFELGGGIAPEAVKAFVVTDEMSNSQNQLANIRRTATI